MILHCEFQTIHSAMGAELLYSRLCSRMGVEAPVMSCPFYTQSISILFPFFMSECLQTTIKYIVRTGHSIQLRKPEFIKEFVWAESIATMSLQTHGE